MLIQFIMAKEIGKAMAKALERHEELIGILFMKIMENEENRDLINKKAF